MPKLVYLEPVRGASFRSRLRSDTLWGALCWNILALYGKQKLESFIGQYKNNQAPLRLSSTFPWAEENGRRYHYLPYPLHPPPSTEPTNTSGSRELKWHMRRQKLRQKHQAWISWEELDYRFGNKKEEKWPSLRPRFDLQPMTHNLVDRRRLGTLTVNGDGQLYHTLEGQYAWSGTAYSPGTTRTGLYFLVEGDHDYLEPALRHLAVNGLGGDRGIGKGHFRIQVVADAHQLGGSTFGLPEVKEPNTTLNLALYHPAETHHDILNGMADHPLLQYKLEDRQGRSLEDSEDQLAGKLYFAEGSVFPSAALPEGAPGHLVPMRRHRFGHQIYRYGYSFPLDLKIPNQL